MKISESLKFITDDFIEYSSSEDLVKKLSDYIGLKKVPVLSQTATIEIPKDSDRRIHKAYDESGFIDLGSIK